MTRRRAPVVAGAVSAATIERVLGVTPSALRKWVQRGFVRHYGHGQYDADDAIARWSAITSSGGK